MGIVSMFDKTLGGVFKSLPSLPENAKETLAKVWPWLALVGGVLQLVGAWGLYDLTRTVNKLNDFVNSFSAFTNTSLGLSSTDKLWLWAGIVLLAVQGVIMLVAFPALQGRKRKGWEWLYLALLIDLVYAVVTIFIVDRGAGTFVMNLIEASIGFYLLYQVKEKFVK